MHLSVLWYAIRDAFKARLVQAGALLILFSGLAEACDQLGAVDLSAVPFLGKYAPAILASAGVAKVVFRVLALALSAAKAQEAPPPQEEPKA
jgi:hypothetical protein